MKCVFAKTSEQNLPVEALEVLGVGGGGVDTLLMWHRHILLEGGWYGLEGLRELHTLFSLSE